MKPSSNDRAAIAHSSPILDFHLAGERECSPGQERTGGRGVRRSIRTVIRFIPRYAPARVLGSFLASLKRGDLGRRAEFREAIRLEPDDRGSPLSTRRILENLMMLDEAIGEHRVAERLQPNSANVAIATSDRPDPR